MSKSVQQLELLVLEMAELLILLAPLMPIQARDSLLHTAAVCKEAVLDQSN